MSNPVPPSALVESKDLTSGLAPARTNFLITAHRYTAGLRRRSFLLLYNGVRRLYNGKKETDEYLRRTTVSRLLVRIDFEIYARTCARVCLL